MPKEFEETLVAIFGEIILFSFLAGYEIGISGLIIRAILTSPPNNKIKLATTNPIKTNAPRV